MFEDIGLGAHLGPVQPQHPHEQKLCEPVAANHPPCLGEARRGEPGTNPRLAADPPRRGARTWLTTSPTTVTSSIGMLDTSGGSVKRQYAS